MSEPAPEPVFIAGPTGIGKTAAALELAQQVGGEIITVDSMQVYCGMNIGTAKPSTDERRRVQQHLLDVADLNDSFDVARFCELAQAAEHDIRSRHRVPIFCGGTGLYFKAYLGGLGKAPPANPQLRAVLAATPLPQLLEELEAADPGTFQTIDRKNPRRIIRAVEVIRITGKPVSEQRANWSAALQPRAFFALNRGPGDLRRRIEARVDAMFEQGLVNEVRTLLPRGLETNPTAMQALGYRQVVEHLNGIRSLAETIELVKIRTWQFARRQMNWFRRQLRPVWLHVPPGQPAAGTAARIQDQLASGTQPAFPRTGTW